MIKQSTLPFSRSGRYNEIAKAIERNLKGKIGSLSSLKDWVFGKEQAAAACHMLQLDVALHVYLRTCFVAGSGDYSLDEAIRLLTQVGFSEQEIRNKAKEEQFSSFFKS